jgi:nucleotide-binding universal stress UspA family protein
MIKDIVVNLSVDTKKDVARDYAISVANIFDAHLSGVAFAYDPLSPGTVFDSASISIIAAQRQTYDDAANTAVTNFDKAARQAAVSAEARVISATIAGCAETFGRIARLYDLSVIGQTTPDSSFQDSMIIEAALFSSGRPVLVVPYIQSEPIKLDRSLVCWDGSRSATRAIADSMPFLMRSKHVEVITVARKDDNRSEISGADVAHHLARHGMKVELKRIVAPDTDVPNVILSYAADAAIDFIVMGGYGHSRLREFVLGGATQGMLGAMTVPTLMSH